MSHVRVFFHKILFQSSYVKHGGKLIDNCPVKKIIPIDENSVKIQLLNGSELKSKSLVVCAGPWTSKFMDPLG